MVSLLTQRPCLHPGGCFLSFFCLVFLCAGRVWGGSLPAAASGSLHLHLQAEHGVYADIGMTQPATDRGPAAVWADSSGAGHHALQATAANRPVYLEGVWGSRPVVRFDGIDDFLDSVFSQMLAQPSTFFLVVDTRNYKNEYIFDGLSSDSRHFLAVGSAVYPGTWMTGAGAVLYSAAVRLNRLSVHTIVFDGTDTSHYIDGILQQVGHGGSHALGGLRIGNRYLGSYYGQFDLAEFVIYQNALSDPDRVLIETFLMEAYSIKPVCPCEPDSYPLSDITQDLAVDFEDFSRLAADWSVSSEIAGVYPPADINQDCTVDLEDAVQLASDWLTPAEQIPALRHPAQPPVQTDLFWQGMGGIHTYRIPAVVTADDGTILAFAEARKISSTDKTPTKLVLRRRLPGQTSWLPVQTVRDDGNHALMDPCAVADRTTGRIWLFHARYPENWDSNNPAAGLGLSSCTVWATWSDDSGASWSAAENITAQVKLESWTHYNLGPGVGIQTTAWPYAGRLIIPCSHGGGTTGNNHIFYSDDHGQSWQIGGYVNAGSESQVVELSSGVLLNNIRKGGLYGRRYSHSYTYGSSWSAVSYDPQLIEPVCQASILRFTKQGVEDRHRILFSNPASGSHRVNMTVRMSYDEGQSWPVAKTLQTGPAGYSCLTVLPDKTIGLLYECGQTSSIEKIRFALFDVAWLTDEADFIY